MAKWFANLLLPALACLALPTLALAQDQPLRHQVVASGLGERVRDVRQGPDGLIYVLTDQARGNLIRPLP